MTAATQAAPPPGGFLGIIEKIGNKVPHPVIMFLYLIAFVIILSQVLYWFDVSVTTEIAVHEDQLVPDLEGEAGDQPVVDNEDPLQHPPPPNLDESDYVIETETIEVNGLLTSDGIALHLLFVRPKLRELHRRRNDLRRDDRRRRRGRSRADGGPHQETREGVAEVGARLHHHPCRWTFEHRD